MKKKKKEQESREKLEHFVTLPQSDKSSLGVRGGSWVYLPGDSIKPPVLLPADNRSLLQSHPSTMSLSAKDKAAVKDLWSKISGKADEIGQDALSR